MADRLSFVSKSGGHPDFDDDSWDGGDMAWSKPAYSRRQVDQAGRAYVAAETSAEDRELALAVINNWRSSHSFPLNTIQVTLRKRATESDTDPTVAQRIKRLPSIQHKLERFPGMNLSRVQDLGGCRAVLSSMESLTAVVGLYESPRSRAKHRLVRCDPYIDAPKDSGYRGVHLVYSYVSDHDEAWNGLKIEIQIRSRLQHAWATAVETVGTFTRQALKSSMGEEEWLRFFALMSSAIALREGTPPVPGTPDDPADLTKELKRHAKRLHVVDRLVAYREAFRVVETTTGLRKGHTFLLELDTVERTLSFRSYESPAIAAEQYAAIERAVASEGDSNKDVVLVSVNSLEALRRAYPNYFLDTSAFVDAVIEATA